MKSPDNETYARRNHKISLLVSIVTDLAKQQRISLDLFIDSKFFKCLPHKLEKGLELYS